MKNSIRIMKASFLFTLLAIQLNCSSSSDPITPTPPPVVTNEVDYWLSKGDQSVLLQKQTNAMLFKTEANSYQNIEVD